MNDKKLRAACYVRCSCESDIMEGSYETQEAYFRQMIGDDPNLTLVECYGDFGKSGGEALTRPGFQQMIRDAEAHKFDVLYTKSVSRFSRNVSDFCETVNHLRGLGINLIFEREGLNTADRTTELFTNILSAVAQEELRSIRENVRLGLEARVSTGHPVGTIPYGYVRINKDSNWGILEEEAKPVEKPAPKPAPTPAEEPPQAYLDALAQVQAENPSIRAPLDSMRFIRFDGQRVVAEFSKKNLMHMKLLERKKSVIEAALSDAFGAPVSLNMVQEGAAVKPVSDVARDVINQSYDVFGRDKIDVVE